MTQGSPDQPRSCTPADSPDCRPEQTFNPSCDHLPGSFVARVFRSFPYAIAGILYLFRTQRNARIELGIAIAACALAAWLRIGRMEWALLVITIALVLALEAINTAIEAAIDLASPDYHSQAKIAKDAAAGAVLLAAIASVVVGLLILLPRLIERLL